MIDRVAVGMALLLGFLWMRTRARALPNPEDGRRALLGIFLVLAPVLIGEKWLFDRLPFDRNINLLIELAALGASFGLIRLLFLRPRTKAPGESPAAEPGT